MSLGINYIIMIAILIVTAVIVALIVFLGNSDTTKIVKEDEELKEDEALDVVGVDGVLPSLDDYEDDTLTVYPGGYEEVSEVGEIEKNFIQKNWKKITPVILILGIALALFFGYRGYIVSKESEEDKVDLVAIQSEFDKYLKDNEEDFNTVIEYGEDYTFKYNVSMLKLLNEEVTEVDVSKVGQHTFVAKFIDNYEIPREIEYTVTIEDNFPPVISGVKNIHLEFGEPLLQSKLGLTAIDPVDGDVSVKVEGEVNTLVGGAYEVNAVAVDKNNVMAREPFVVVVAERDNNRPIQVEGTKPESSDEPGDTPDIPDVPDIPDKPLLSIQEVSLLVIRGDYGNYPVRQQRLEADGYNYADVQAEVNKHY